MKKRVFWTILYSLFFLSAGISNGQEGDAGVESPFTIGLGARSLALGNTMTAYPNDPTAFFWNPAGMVVVDQKGVDISLATFFAGTKHIYLGYIHPTLNIGVIGFGLSWIGTDDIVQRSWTTAGTIQEAANPVGFWWGKLTIAYARTILKGFSLGLNLNIDRQELGSYSANGFDVDFGVHYTIPADRGFLKNLYFGFSAASVFSSRLRLGVTAEAIPYNARAGIAKKFEIRNSADYFLLSADIEKGEYKQLRYHIGAEYGFNNIVFLRAGADNGYLGFGGGIRYHTFQIDYGTGPMDQEGFLPWHHRFSVILHLGKRIPEQRRILEEQRQREIEMRIQDAQDAERQKLIREGLQAGQDYLDKQDYFNARLEISRVLRADKDNERAKELLRVITEGETEYQQKREEELLKQDREAGQRQRDIVFINQRLEEGNEASLKGDFKKAIEKWQEALERDPNNLQIQNYIRQAKAELTNDVNQLIAEAERLIRQGESSEAYKVLDQAKNRSEDDAELHAKVLKKIEGLNRNIDFLSNYNAGVQYFNKRQYEAAARSFQKALEYDPNNVKAKELYRSAYTRYIGKKGEISGEALNKLNRGTELYIDGRYQEALKVFEEALVLDPNNMIILEHIENVKKKIEIYEKQD
jgi:tetratricopeptide (TPR) repeat protein